MKSDSNTEMDLLLRRHARRKAGLVSGAGDSRASATETMSTGPHMDTDEMNAYAEGVLPVEARARSLAHLADCDRCRAIVTELALAANVPIADEERAQQLASTPRSSWREWLAALFAPPMIRYGAMAMALLCVVGVVFLAMRQQRSSSSQQGGPTYVAQNNEGTQQPASAVKPAPVVVETPATKASPVAPGVETNAAPAKDNAGTQTRPPADTETDAVAKQAKEQQPLGATKTDAPAAAGAPLPSSEPKQEATERGDEALAARNSPAAPPSPTTTSSGVAGGRVQETTDVDSMSQTRNERETRDERAPRSGVMSNTTSTRESEEAVRMRRPARAPEARQKAADKVQTMRDGSDTNSAGSAAGARSAETRSVGGRSFRRDGGAWVDTAYSSGRATVNIRRGSEQYRALVADEPGLRAIADQLSGEVIVVWKGRAYRIH
jgi:hypothetical protein